MKGTIVKKKGYNLSRRLTSLFKRTMTTRFRRMDLSRTEETSNNAMDEDTQMEEDISDSR